MMSRFEIDKDGITVFDNHTGNLFECKYSNEAESLCKLLNMFEENTEDLIYSNNTMKKIINRKNELQDEDLKKNAWLQTKYTELDFLKDENAHMRQVLEENKQLKSFKNDVHYLIDKLIKKAEKDVEDLRKDAYEKKYAYNPYYYWGVVHGLENLKKELKE